MTLVERLLNRLFPREELPFGTRWRVLGRKEPRADYSRAWLALPAPFQAGLYIHRMVRGDTDRAHHDHRYNWLSIVLKGGYVESLLDPSGLVTVKHRRWLSCAWRPAMQPHTVEKLLAPVTWTLFVTGKHQREWGFWLWSEMLGAFRWVGADEYRKYLETHLKGAM